MAPVTLASVAHDSKMLPKSISSQPNPTPASPRNKRDTAHQFLDEPDGSLHESTSSRSGSTPHNFKKPRTSNSVQHPPDGSIVRWDNDNEQQNSTLQLAWDRKMQEGKQYTSTKCYKEVHVLMISWDSESDDLKLKKEVQTLGAVFKDQYNFEVHPVYLMNNTPKLPRHQIQKHVADFVYEHDKPKALLIVYFAGHGTPGENSGELKLHGNVDQIRAHRNEIIWNHTEGALRGTEADVLQIFDCCYAGEMGHRGYGLRLFEYLAATSSFETPGPGTRSFTSALIWALKKLAKDGGRFTSSDLLRLITKDAPHFPRNQHPVLSKPDGNHSEFIVIEPLAKKGSKSSSPLQALVPTNQAGHLQPQDVLTLRYVFETRPSVQMIETLGEHTNHIIEKLSCSMEDFRVNRIMYGGLQSFGRDHRGWTRDPIVIAANRFLMLRRSPKPNETSMDESTYDDSCT